ncbi:hypothetical protein NP493_503g01019 [Ridgeia piscesae]|uniref:Uncharacterized protein n=1 Tax=Ridgeia piscesae TaxID=27915 RepID=A0AAD9NQP2_RIDPI|nr:hypothetical protein NP493_503g01019 [Ridgeia piscesae]
MGGGRYSRAMLYVIVKHSSCTGHSWPDACMFFLFIELSAIVYLNSLRCWLRRRLHATYDTVVFQHRNAEVTAGVPNYVNNDCW